MSTGRQGQHLILNACMALGADLHVQIRSGMHMHESVRELARLDLGSAFAGGVKAVTEVLQLIGGATLAVQTVVLGASLFQKGKKQARAPDQGAFSDASAAGSGSSQQTSPDPRIMSLSPTGDFTARQTLCKLSQPMVHHL